MMDPENIQAEKNKASCKTCTRQGEGNVSNGG
jgi:hypothetical protein